MNRNIVFHHHTLCVLPPVFFPTCALTGLHLLQGPGLVILEDGTQFEGEVGPGGSFAGKGILRYPTGDVVEGSFSGSFPGPVKISGVLRRGGGSGSGSSIGAGGEGGSGVPRYIA